MPVYLYQNPKTKEVKQVVQSVNDKHEYFEGELAFDRVWTIPQASIDTRINPEKSSDFVEKTRNKRGSLGEIWDKSQELSEKRSEKFGGKDPVKENYIAAQKKVSKGKHVSEVIAAKKKTYEIEITGKKAKVNVK